MSRKKWLLLGALLVSTLLLIQGCESLYRMRFGMRAMMQEEPDYDAVEAESTPATATKSEDEPQAHPEPYWTDFRGPQRLAVYDETPILTDWPQGGLRELWRRSVGASYGSLTVAHGLAFALEQRREAEALIAYELDTGREAWVMTWPARFEEALSGEGPRSTPVYADGFVWTLGALGELRCVEARTGELRWRKNVLDLAGADNLEYALAATPLLNGENLIVPTGVPRAGGATVIALKRDTGELVWKALTDEASYVSPLSVQLGGEPQVLLSTRTRLVALEPRTGELLWDFPWAIRRGQVCSQPIVVDAQRVALSGGYGKGSALVEVTHTADGWNAREIWQSRRFKNRLNSSVLIDGHLYGLDEGVLACLDLATGERVWRDGRYGFGQILLAQGHLIVLDGDGVLRLVDVSPEGQEERHSFQAIEGLTMNIPALAHGRLLVRNKLEMACYELWPVDENEPSAKPALAPR